MPRFAVEGGHVHFEVQGQGPDVVLLHGLGWDGSIWDPVVERIADRVRCIVPDLRGHGRSACTEPFPPEAWVDDLRLVLRAARARHPVMVAHSLGAWVGLRWAMVSRRRPSGLVLLSPKVRLEPRVKQRLQELPARLRSQPAHEVLKGCLLESVGARWREANPKALGAQKQRLVEASGESLALAAEAMLACSDTSSSVSRMQCRVQLCVGADDTTAPLDGWRQAISYDALRVLPEVGHLVPLEAPEVVAEEVLRALEGETE